MSALQSTVGISSASSLAANGRGAMDKRLLEADIGFLIAIRSRLGLLVCHVVVWHDGWLEEEELVPQYQAGAMAVPGM